jgi:glycosyltransferase involved in cell wall biosynthesis
MEILYEPGRRFRKAALLVRDTWKRRKAVDLAPAYDGIVIHREAAPMGPAWLERLLRRTGLPLIYDFDDAIWVPSSGSANGVFSRLKFPGKTATICRLASAISVGNEYLASFARQFNSAVHVVPTSIELSEYQVRAPVQAEGFIVGWSGSHSTLIHLELARGALMRLGRTRKTSLLVVCSRPPDPAFDAVETSFIRWSPASEVDGVAGAHVGIMPLPDDRFAQGKCALKALQYMAIGRPVVVSPVGVNASIIRSGENGILARTEDEWVQSLATLADSESLRERLGRAARKTVEEGFSSEVASRRFANVVRQALGYRATEFAHSPVGQGKDLIGGGTH